MLSLEDLHFLILGYINIYVYSEMRKINAHDQEIQILGYFCCSLELLHYK